MKKQFNEEVSNEIRPVGGYTEIYRTLFGDRNKKDNDIRKVMERKK
ncbi:hypothetical protein ACWE42_06090 [Sutcliffiella cohnii]|nr:MULTISPECIES: hypothetical protein [Sutcliffiella]MED4014885.1 hypothetical protein [Sutcliffiella cohnii]WBL17374.1 hypothetical protein O1A01_12380 [Sutcliffiella sp. NC1]